MRTPPTARRLVRLSAPVALALLVCAAPLPAAADGGPLLPAANPKKGEHAIEAGAAFTLGAYHRVSVYDKGDYRSRVQGGFAPGFVLWADYMTKYLGGGLDVRMIFPGPTEGCAAGVCLSKSRVEAITGVKIKRATSFAILPFVKARFPIWIAEPYAMVKLGYLFYNDDNDLKGYGNGLGLALVLGSLFKVTPDWAVSFELEYLYGCTWYSEDKHIRFATNAVNLNLGAAYLF